MTESPLATFWPQPTEATRFWRCEVPARYLPGVLGPVDNDGMLNQMREPGPDGMPRLQGQRGDVAVFQFPARPERLACIQTLMLRGKRVLFECDDNYLVVPPHLPPPYTRNDIIYEPPHNPEDARSSIRVARHAASMAHGVIASTRYLEKLYRRECNPYTYYCPNCIDPPDWPGEDDHHTDDVFRVGMVGSISHFHDLPLITSALEWATRQDGVEVVTVGCDHPDWARLENRKHVPYVFDYDEYRRVFTQFDVVLCPVFPSDWSRARSDNKVLESALGGAMAIVSPADPFKEWTKTDLVRTVKVNTQTGFRRELQWAVEHRDEVRDIARACRDRVLETRTIEGNIWRWRAACEWPSKRRRKVPTVAVLGNGTSGDAYAQALVKARWRLTAPQHADVFLVDYPVEFWGDRWQWIRDTKAAGGVVGEIPHGMMPMVTLDGAVDYHPDVDFSVVPADGWVDLYRAMGIDRDMIVAGWSMTPLADWRPLPRKVGRVLFAPIHPNTGDGGKTTLPWAQRENELTYRLLCAATGVKKTVRFYGDEIANGIHRRVNGVEYVKVEQLAGPDWSEIDEADLVISYGSFLFMALARGVPAVAIADVPPIRDDGTVVARNFEAWRHLWEYPVKVGDSPSLAGLIQLTRDREPEIRAWRDRYVGEEFDAARFAVELERRVFERDRGELIAA